MPMGARTPEHIAMFVSQDQLLKAPTAPFFDKLNELLDTMCFDTEVETLCRPCYAERLGRLSLAPGLYFRLLLGYRLGQLREAGAATVSTMTTAPGAGPAAACSSPRLTWTSTRRFPRRCGRRSTQCPRKPFRARQRVRYDEIKGMSVEAQVVEIK